MASFLRHDTHNLIKESGLHWESCQANQGTLAPVSVFIYTTLGTSSHTSNNWENPRLTVMVLITVKITPATSVKKPKKLTLVDPTSKRHSMQERGDLFHWWTSWILSGSLECDASQSRSTEYKAIPWQEILTFYQMKGFKLVLWNFTEASGEGLMGRELLTE